MKGGLYLDWATSKAAKYACQRWHYSGTVPSAQCRIGVWEDRQFVGVVLFGIGAGHSTDGRRFGLKRAGEVAELVRVALRDHRAPVSRIIRIAVKMMKRKNPGIRLVVSFADYKAQGHIGTIYQAGNWVYSGAFDGDGGWLVHGKPVHTRTITSRKGWKATLKWLRENVDPNTEKVKTLKHRYLLPLDAEMRERIAPMAKPYPKREKQAMAGSTGTAAVQRRPSRSISP